MGEGKSHGSNGRQVMCFRYCGFASWGLKGCAGYYSFASLQSKNRQMILLKTVTDFEFVFGQRLKSQAQDGSLVLAVQEVKKGLCPFVSISFLFTGIFSLGGPAFLFFLLLKKKSFISSSYFYCHRYCPQI